MGVPVCEVAGVMDPHKLVKALAPPRGKLQPHMEGAFRLGGWVSPAEPAPLVLGHLLQSHKYKIFFKKVKSRVYVSHNIHQEATSVYHSSQSITSVK